LRRAAATTGGLAALSLIGCGGGKSDSKPAAAPAARQEMDPLKGTRGGKLVFQAYADWGGIVVARARNAGIHQAASFTHSGLYQTRNGRPGVDLSDLSSELDLATAMPETPPDKLSWVVKLTPGAKFHNGKVVTSEDVKYSFDRYAFDPDSAYKVDFPWLDKVEAPDPNTVVFKAKFPYADVPGSLTGRNYGHVLSKEHEESRDAINKLVGSGAYTFVDRQAPTLNGRFRRNPEYFKQPLPYFDEIEVLGTSDVVKKVADFSSKQVHVTYWFDEINRDQVKKARPDALLFENIYPSWAVTFRNDLAPFNDKRVRQAASMLINRKQIIDAVYNGEGSDDQWFSWTVKYWGFRKPSELPGAKYWKNDPAEAKKLLSAAGITSAKDSQNLHWDATVVGQGIVDMNTLISTQWRNAGFLNSKDTPLLFPQYASTVAIGNFEGWFAGPSGGGILDPGFGNAYRNAIWSPPDGVKGPSVNNGHINDPKLSELVDKQMGQFDPNERKQTFRAMEDIMSEEQYKLALNTFTNNFFADPSLQNIQLPITHVNGSVHYVKNWWFKDGKAP
jgi:peptide/nickel transport system substrate-binding protein